MRNFLLKSFRCGESHHMALSNLSMVFMGSTYDIMYKNRILIRIESVDSDWT